MTGLMKSALLLPLVFVGVGAASRRADASQPLSPVEAQSAGEAEGARVPASGPLPQAGELVQLFAGRSMVVSSPDPLKRVAVTDPKIASATIITPYQVLIHGHVAGEVTLILWDEREEMRSYALRVELDLSDLRETLTRVVPGSTIELDTSGSAIVVRGTVPSKAVADQVVLIAQSHAEKVVNLLVEAGDQVLLQVRFAEIDRAAVQQFGVNLFGTGATLGGMEITGNVSTQQFLQTLANIGGLPADVQGGRPPDAPNLVTGGAAKVGLTPPPVATFGLSDLLNILVFLPERNVGVVIRALEQRNLLEILAEPNLLAQNGREASFLAGGEFPFPAVQSVAGGLAISVQFREFGVRLRFTPSIQGDGTIALKLVQEVSSLDFANALTISGFLVPALSTRRAETELQLQNGQSFAIAGLLDNRVTEVVSKIPWLGDIPILGKLFKSSSLQRNNSELMVLVTAKRVQPLPAGEVAPGPAFPAPFLDKEKFDEKQKKGDPKKDEEKKGEPKPP